MEQIVVIRKKSKYHLYKRHSQILSASYRYYSCLSWTLGTYSYRLIYSFNFAISKSIPVEYFFKKKENNFLLRHLTIKGAILLNS